MLDVVVYCNRLGLDEGLSRRDQRKSQDNNNACCLLSWLMSAI
jgi:hypothetical protein